MVAAGRRTATCCLFYFADRGHSSLAFLQNIDDTTNIDVLSNHFIKNKSPRTNLKCSDLMRPILAISESLVYVMARSCLVIVHFMYTPFVCM